MSWPKTVFEPYTDPKNCPFRQKKVKTDSKIKSKSKVIIEENVENKSLSTTWVDHKTYFQPYPDPKNSSLGSQKVKKTKRLSKDEKWELKEL